LFEKKFNEQTILIDNLLTRVSALESNTKLNKHILRMQVHKLHDQQQFSRKVNLMIEGNEVGSQDFPRYILDNIKEEVRILNIDIPENEYDSVHRTLAVCTKEMAKRTRQCF
jgi:hypothetical protein